MSATAKSATLQSAELAASRVRALLKPSANANGNGSLPATQNTHSSTLSPSKNRSPKGTVPASVTSMNSSPHDFRSAELAATTAGASRSDHRRQQALNRPTSANSTGAATPRKRGNGAGSTSGVANNAVNGGGHAATIPQRELRNHAALPSPRRMVTNALSPSQTRQNLTPRGAGAAAGAAGASPSARGAASPSPRGIRMSLEDVSTHSGPKQIGTDEGRPITEGLEGSKKPQVPQPSTQTQRFKSFNPLFSEEQS